MRNNAFINETKIYENKSNNELSKDSNKEALRNSNNNNNLNPPPCFWENENGDKMMANIDMPKKENDIKNSENSYNLITSEIQEKSNEQNEEKNKIFSNENTKDKNKESLYINQNKQFSNTSKGDNKENNSFKNEENLVEIFKNIIDDRPSNPYRINNDSSYYKFNNNVRDSNPYRISNDISNNKSNFNLYSIYQGVKPKNIRKLNTLKMNIEKKAAYKNIHKKRNYQKQYMRIAQPIFYTSQIPQNIGIYHIKKISFLTKNFTQIKR